MEASAGVKAGARVTAKTKTKVAVVGAGIGGLCAAIELAAAGYDVEVFESAAEPGGKMRQLPVAGRGVDAGPTVFTMRWVFDGLLAAAGTTLESIVTLQQADVLARHAWTQGGRLDLHADREQSAVAIAEFAGAADAQGYRDFCARSEDIFTTLREPFIAAQRPGMLALTRRVGFGRIDALWRTAPWRSLWSALGDHFTDPRLQQLFGRYATYVGSSPLSAPATLMLIAHVEQEGVWYVDGGMRGFALALARVLEGLGGKLHCGAAVEEILARDDRVSGVRVAGSERAADAVVFNGDVSALGTGLLGAAGQRAVQAVPASARALSAVTFCAVATVRGFPLHYHNVFFAPDYPAEFQAIFEGGGICATPTVYVCAADRAQGGEPDGPERLLLLINAPADGDHAARDDATRQRLLDHTLGMLADCGAELDLALEDAVVTDPAGYAARFPGSGGSLYGRANHGMNASFKRPGARSALPGLYLAGGSAHPGAGVPMAAMSGRLAAAALLDDSDR
uniref:Methoxyneurosporene dehydrogenase n=1 Tax=Haliea sp. ETY-M TaxID=1055105 RepID=A0A455R310_9GAMM|nr:methoxyneurosporene dehydrogenase [Haliea sp. ETY-M]